MSEQNQNDIMAKVGESLDSVGGKTVVGADCSWSSGQWQFFGVKEFPSVEARQQHVAEQREIGFLRYVRTTAVLGIKRE